MSSDLIKIRMSDVSNGIVIDLLRPVTKNHFVPVQEEDSNIVDFILGDADIDEEEDLWTMVKGPKGLEAVYKVRFIYWETIQKQIETLKKSGVLVTAMDEAYLITLYRTQIFTYPISNESQLEMNKHRWEDTAIEKAILKFINTVGELNAMNG